MTGSISPTASIEVERKYEVPTHAERPYLSGVACVSVVSAPESANLDAIYFDTDDCALLAHKVTVRRREGGVDEGWHVKLPAREGRRELHWSLGLPVDAKGIPRPVREVVSEWVGNRWLDPVARIRTHRITQLLQNSSGVTVAEFVRDEVHALNYWSLSESHWQEWEVELGPGAPGSRSWRSRILNDVQRRLEAVGATLSARPSKLGTVLDTSGPQASGAALGRVLFRLYGELVDLVPRAASDEPDAVHQARIRVRRIRSLLAAFRPLLPVKRTIKLRNRLRELGYALAPSRDLEVLAGRAEGEFLVDAHAETRDKVVGQIRSEHARAHGELRRLLRGAAMTELLDDLREFALDPASGEAARLPATETLPRLLAPLADEVSTLLGHALREFDSLSQEQLHLVRRRGRRLRYAADAAETFADGAVAAALTLLEDAGHTIQDVIGEYRDDVIFAQSAEEGIHPAIAPELAEDQRARYASAARTRGESTLGELPGALVALDDARSALAAALFTRCVPSVPA